MGRIVAAPRRTARLTLRPLVETDIEQRYALRSQPIVHQWLSDAPRSLADFRDRTLRHLDDPDLALLAVEADGAFVGDATLRVEDGWAQDGLPEARHTQAEIGYVIDPAYAGRGFATEVTRALITIGFDELGLRRLHAGCFADNLASRRVLEKCGFRLEGTMVAESLHRDRGWLDGCVYGLLAEEDRAWSTP